jgi:hypothetical protein
VGRIAGTIVYQRSRGAATLSAKNISKKEYPHRDLSTGSPGFPVEMCGVDQQLAVSF